MSGRARTWLTMAGAALAVAMGIVLFRESAPARAPRPAAGEAAPAEAARAETPAFRGRDFYPAAAGEEPPAAAATGAQASVPAPAAHLPGANIPVNSYAPPAPRQSATSWIHEYTASVCACTTRECVRELQTRFIHAMNTTEFDEERDGEAYTEGARQAVKCLGALPANS